jgi:2-oxoisovalerate dehydrogenase E2 component (dihydrolipoyl transacylase)
MLTTDSPLPSFRPNSTTQMTVAKRSRPSSTAIRSIASAVAHDDFAGSVGTGGLGRAGGGGGIPFLLADIGEGIKEVELLQWFVQPGEHVRQFDKVCEVQSDKATVEITSRYDGVVLELAGRVGDMMQVGKPLLYIDSQQHQQQQAAASSNLPPSESTKAPTSGTASQELPQRQTLSNVVWEDADDDGASGDHERLKIPTIASHYRLESDRGAGDGPDSRKSEASQPFQASPAVRKLGKEHQLDLTVIHPSGPNGRLLKADVVTYLKEQGRWKGGDEAASVASSAPFPSPSAVSDAVRHDHGEDTIVQLKGYHRLMMQSMTAALQIPHMGFGDELVVTKLVQCRRELNDANPDPDHRLSMLTLLIKACSLALTEYPMVNAVVHDAEACQLRLSRHHNIGIAVDTPRGLVVPVIHSVQNKSLPEIQQGKNNRDLKSKVRALHSTTIF